MRQDSLNNEDDGKEENEVETIEQQDSRPALLDRQKNGFDAPESDYPRIDVSVSLKHYVIAKIRAREETP